MDILESIQGIFNTVGGWIWYVAFAFLVGLGLYFTFKLRGQQILKVKDNAKIALKDDADSKSSKLTAFETFCITMGARIGVGNIAGVATALMTGGPGAVFWMWIFAIIGAASSFMESTLSQIYKEQKQDGGYHGGPAYYVTKGLKNRKFGILISALSIMAFTIGFTMSQSCNATTALCGAFNFANNNLFFAMIIVIVTALLVFGGFKKIGSASTYLVPIMALMWASFAVVIMIVNHNNIIPALSSIFANAFTLPSVIGGGFGTIIDVGLRRGVFSNEAGLGSVSTISATSEVSHPIKMGMSQSFGVLFNSLLLCTLTALTVLSYGTFNDIFLLHLDGSQLVEYVATDALGKGASLLIAMFMSVFAFTSIIGYAVIGESCTRFIKDDDKLVYIIRIALLAAVIFGAVTVNVTLVNSISDVFMGLIAICNMAAIALLSKRVFEAYDDYKKQKKEGIESPVFHKDALSDDTGVTEWD